jgi:DNA repair ATPase RecN
VRAALDARRQQLRTDEGELARAEQQAADLARAVDAYELDVRRHRLVTIDQPPDYAAPVSAATLAGRAAAALADAEQAAGAAQQALADADRRLAESEDARVAHVPLADARAAVARAEQHADRLRLLDRTLDTAYNQLEFARTAILDRVTQGIRDNLRLLLPELTRDRDLTIDVDRHLGLLVGETGRPPRQPEQNSHSTAELSMVLARLALVRHLTDGKLDVPLLLDDVTSNADGERVHRVLGLLRRFAEQCQVVVFAHENAAREWAERHRTADPRISLHRLTGVDDDPVAEPPPAERADGGTTPR